jgi:integrase
MRTEKAIVLGPYVEKHGEKERFRLILKSSGRRKSLFYATLAEARRAKAQLEKEVLQLNEKTVGELIDEYGRYVEAYEGYREKTRATERTRLLNFFANAGSMRLSTITENKAEQMYQSHAQRLGYRTGRVLSPATHRGDLRLLKRFGSWAQSAGHVGQNPFAHVEPLGRDRAGKPQLRMDELDRWLQVAWQDVQRGDTLALIAMLCLWRGLRVSEVLNRSVRDLDEGGAVLVIEHAKTRAGNRRIDIPEFLRPFVQRHIEDQQPDAWLFRQELEPWLPRRQQSVHKRVRSICKRAGVPPICTHSLRGMNATLKVQAGASEDYVARSIGHTSFGVTLRHYVDPAVKASVDAQRVDAILSKVGRAPVEKAAPSPSAMQVLLDSLSAADRDVLRQALLLEPVQRQ